MSGSNVFPFMLKFYIMFVLFQSESGSFLFTLSVASRFVVFLLIPSWPCILYVAFFTWT